MLPGVTSGLYNSEGKVLRWSVGDKRALVASNEKEYKIVFYKVHVHSTVFPAIGVGILECSPAEVSRDPRKGKCMKMLHIFQDHLWFSSSEAFQSLF